MRVRECMLLMRSRWLPSLLAGIRSVIVRVRLPCFEITTGIYLRFARYRVALVDIRPRYKETRAETSERVIGPLKGSKSYSSNVSSIYTCVPDFCDKHEPNITTAEYTLVDKRGAPPVVQSSTYTHNLYVRKTECGGGAAASLSTITWT